MIGTFSFVVAEDENDSSTISENSIVCAMDAKICDDGISVGRTGPNCEFICSEDTLNEEINPTTIDSTGVVVARKIGFFEDRMDRLRLAFTFNKEKKIEMALNMAEKKLAEAELLAEEDPEAYEKAQARYNELVAKAEKVLEAMESRAQNNKSSAGDIERIVRVQNRFEKHQDNAEKLYARAYDRLEANGADAEKVERLEKAYERYSNRTGNIEERIMKKKANILLKHKALGEMSEEDLEEFVSQIENSEGLTGAREIRMDDSGALKKNIAKMRLRNSDGSANGKATNDPTLKCAAEGETVYVSETSSTGATPCCSGLVLEYCDGCAADVLGTCVVGSTGTSTGANSIAA